MFSLFFQLKKKVLDPNGPYKDTFQTILRNVCLSVNLVTQDYNFSHGFPLLFSVLIDWRALRKCFILKPKITTSIHIWYKLCIFGIGWIDRDIN